jgi:hypothetical protein
MQFIEATVNYIHDKLVLPYKTKYYCLMDTSYTPVSYDFREVITEQIAKQTSGKVFFWNAEQVVDEVIGRVIKLEEIPGKGMFIVLDSGAQVRIDRIITLFGKPGAAFDEYDSFANQCLACTAGVPL